MRKKLAFLRIPVSLLLLALVIWRVSPGNLIQEAGRTDFWVLVAAFGIVLTGHCIRIVKWAVLVWPFGIDVPFSRLAVFYFHGLFFNMLLPGNIGGDAVKGLSLASHVKNNFGAFTSVIIDRFTGLLAVLMICSVSLGLNSDRITDQRVYAVVLFFWIAVGCFLFAVYGTQLGSRIRVVGAFREAAQLYRRHKGRVMAALLIALVFQAVIILNNYMVAVSIGLEGRSVWDFFAMLPIAFVVAMLPISIGGLGAREWAYWFLFTKILGYPQDKMVAVSLLIFTCEVVLAIIGGVTYVLGRKTEKEGK